MGDDIEGIQVQQRGHYPALRPIFEACPGQEVRECPVFVRGYGSDTAGVHGQQGWIAAELLVVGRSTLE